MNPCVQPVFNPIKSIRSTVKTQAKELGDKLLPAFSTKSGIPTPRVSFKSGRNSGGSKSVLAEIGTLQVCNFMYGIVWYGMAWYGLVWYGMV